MDSSIFDHPMESGTLLRKKIKTKKELLEAGGNFIEKRIAVLGGSTTNEIVDRPGLFFVAL